MNPTEDTPTPQGGLEQPSGNSQSDATKSLTQDEVLNWPEIGQTENEEWGVDDVRAKKINGKWCYVQLNWRYHNASIGWVLYDGRLLEEDDTGGIDLITEGLSQSEDTPSCPGEHKKQELERRK